MENISNLLLTWDEFNRKEFAVPYIYHIQKEGQMLAYFGALHTQDAAHPQFKMLEEEWKQFLLYPGDRKVAVAEGSALPPIGSLDEAVRMHGEAGYLKWLCERGQIELIFPDPKLSELWAPLYASYSRDEIFYYEVIQIAYQWNRTAKHHSFQEYFEYFAPEYREQIGWEDYDFLVGHASVLQKEYFGTEFDPSDSKFFYDHINPAHIQSKFNQLSRDMDMVRDSAIVRSIKEKWDTGFSIFVVFGSGHAVIEEPALRSLLK